ncbi:hypothetical protein V500_11416 [Pseudogymnoascus sp. VKM F-4518 (FW-2643)]|nr:hypothetical protein V500_11416 [Pseudogymnoascus sp. VKM F-4518 (FW-2643)]
MKITASLAPAENIVGTDETRRKRKKKKGTERDSGSRKNDGHLTVPVWDTKGTRAKNRRRSRSVGPSDRCNRPKTDRSKIGKDHLATVDLDKQEEERRAASRGYISTTVSKQSTGLESGQAHWRVRAGRGVFYGKMRPGIGSDSSQIFSTGFISGYSSAELCAFGCRIIPSKRRAPDEQDAFVRWPGHWEEYAYRWDQLPTKDPEFIKYNLTCPSGPPILASGAPEIATSDLTSGIPPI